MTIKSLDKAIIMAGSALILASIYFFFILSPAIERKSRLEGLVSDRESDFSSMIEMTDEWVRFREKQLSIERQLEQDSEGFSLLSFLEGIARQEGIAQNIQYMKPLSVMRESSPVSVDGMEMKLERIGMDGLVPFLVQIENSDKLMTINRIKISRLSERESAFLEVTLQVHSYTAKRGEKF